MTGKTPLFVCLFPSLTRNCLTFQLRVKWNSIEFYFIHQKKKKKSLVVCFTFEWVWIVCHFLHRISDKPNFVWLWKRPLLLSSCIAFISLVVLVRFGFGLDVRVCVCVFQCTFPFVKLHMFAYKMLLTNECVDMRSRKDKLQSVFVSSQICAEASVLDQVLDTAKHKWAKDTKTTDTHSKNKTQRDRRE